MSLSNIDPALMETVNGVLLVLVFVLVYVAMGTNYFEVMLSNRELRKRRRLDLEEKALEVRRLEALAKIHPAERARLNTED